jgi:hypothetical protein
MVLDIHPLVPICLLPLLLGLLSACTTVTPVTDRPSAGEVQRIQELQLVILALDESIDRDEAARAANIAIEYPLQLAEQYEITDPPLLHNFLVNIGVKPRGLCTHWTWDLYTRLQQERFRSIDLHWGIANYDSAFRLEHSSVIISARDSSMQQGLVLDPWRNAGQLFWAQTLQDPIYQWHPQAEIHARKRERKALAENRAVER